LNRSGSIVHRLQTNSKGVRGSSVAGRSCSGDEVVEVPNELIVGFVVVSLDGRVLNRPIHPLDDAVMRSAGALCPPVSERETALW
jgi:predicted regulator of Ras-like GTPase activity (Roadblock/LC7/MglB family)